MGETLSPTRQRLPVAARIQSPTSPFLLGSNDDQLERAQARAARAAAIRRKAHIDSQSADAGSDPCLNKQQIFDLFQNCIKLASENVNAKEIEILLTYLLYLFFDFLFALTQFEPCLMLF